MMPLRIPFLSLAVFLSALPAATPVAVITGAGDLDVNGRRLSREITSSVTLFSSDEVQTQKSTAVVWLGGGARLTVDRNSVFQLERKLGATELTLRQGGVRFDTGASRESLSIRAGDHLVTPDANSAGAVILRPDRTAEAMTLRGSAGVLEKSTGTYQRLRGQSGLMLNGSDGRMLLTGRTAPATDIRYVAHPLVRKTCPVSPTETKHGKCKCPPPSDATNPPEGDHNCGHGNGP